MSAPPAGWHADPAGGRGLYRWWDGAGWTRWLSRDSEAAPPGEAPTLTPVAGPALDETVAPGAADGAAAVAVGPSTAGPQPHPPSPLPLSPLPPSERFVRMPVAVAVVVGALLVALVAVGAVVSASASRLPSGPAVAPPSPSSVAALSYDPATRAGAVAELHANLAGPPYTCAGSPEPLRPTLASAVICSATVHAKYGTSHSDWAATTGMGTVPDEVVVAGDVGATADRVFASLRSQFFAGQRTEVRKRQTSPTDLAPAGSGVVTSGEVHYRVRGVASRYDRVSMLVVELADGHVGVWFSSRPDDTPAAALAALDASISTVRAR